MPAFGRLVYLYVGTSDVEDALAFFRDRMGADVLWDSSAFGTRVAAVRLGAATPLLLAGHRHAPSVLPIFAVEDLAGIIDQLAARGWRPEGDVFGVPDGPCVLFKDPSGNEFALLQQDRPDAMMADDGDGNEDEGRDGSDT